MFKRFSLTAFFLVIAGAIASAGLWYPIFPIVGSAAYCQSTINGTCSQYTPAGPASLTGNELIPADTQLTQGRQPQTVLIPLAAIGAAPPVWWTVTNGQAFYSETISNNVGKLIFVAANTISDARVTAPAAPIDGQIVRVSSTHTITAFQFIANTGQTLAVTTPTVLTASTTADQGYSWIYRASDAKWYRLQ